MPKKTVICEVCECSIRVPDHHIDEGWCCNECIDLIFSDDDLTFV